MKRVAPSVVVAALIVACLVPLVAWPQPLQAELPVELPIPTDLLDANVGSAATADLRRNADAQAQILGVLYRPTLILPWQAERAARRYFAGLPDFAALQPPYDYTIVGLASPVGELYDLIGYVVQPIDSLGFLVLSADQRVEPLIAYSGSSVFPWTQEASNTLLDFVGEDLGKRIAASDAGRVDRTYMQSNTDTWNELASPVLVLPPRPLALYASLTRQHAATTDPYAERIIRRPAIWVQDRLPFNGATPTCGADPSFGHRKVGCVALALADLLYHFEAVSGTTATFVDAPYLVTCPSPAGAETETRSYSEDLTLSYGGGEVLLGTENASIAKLAFAAGVSVVTKYNEGYSTAMFSEIEYALCQVWGYSSEKIDCNGAASSAFYARIADELVTYGRPILLDLKGASVDHTVVCDGTKRRDANLPGSEVHDYHLRLGYFVQTAKSDVEEGNAWYALPQEYPDGYTAVDEAVVGIQADPQSCAPPAALSVGQPSAGPDAPCAAHAVRFRLDRRATITFAHYYWWPCEGTVEHRTLYSDLEPGTYTLLEEMLAGPGVHTFAVLVERNGRTEVYTDQVVVGSTCGAEAPDGLLGAASLSVCCDRLGGAADRLLRVNYSILVESVSYVRLVVLQPQPGAAIRGRPAHPSRAAVNKLLGSIDDDVPGTRLVVLVAVTNRGIVSAYDTFDVAPP